MTWRALRTGRSLDHWRGTILIFSALLCCSARRQKPASMVVNHRGRCFHGQPDGDCSARASLTAIRIACSI